MALRDSSLTSTSFSPLRFPNWQREYESALLETDKSVLFKRVEVAEAAILARRDALEHDSRSQTERVAIEDALANLSNACQLDLSFFTDAPGLPRVQEYMGIITPPIVQTARTACLNQSLGEKAALLFTLAEMQLSLFRTRLIFLHFCIFTQLARMGEALGILTSWHVRSAMVNKPALSRRKSDGKAAPMVDGTLVSNELLLSLPRKIGSQYSRS